MKIIKTFTSFLKREYHSSVIISKYDNKIIKNSYLLSYLDSIKEIINNHNYTSEEAQEIIENN
jgi:hypothetical protein